MNPVFDYHALAPEIILTTTIVVVLVADFFFRDRERFQTSRLATIGGSRRTVRTALAG